VLYFLALIASTYKRFKDNAYEREIKREEVSPSGEGKERRRDRILYLGHVKAVSS